MSSIKRKDGIIPALNEYTQIVITYTIVTLGWVFFRSETIEDSFIYIYKMFEPTIGFKGLNKTPILIFFLFLEWKIKEDERKIYNEFKPAIKKIIDFIIIYLIISNFNNNQDFIYFNF